ncbi:MAG: glycosyltransferase family 4 protein [Aureispira sp.]
MRLFICTHYSANYGANKSLLDLIKGFLELKYEIIVVLPSQGDFVAVLKAENVNYHIHPFYTMTYKPWRKSALFKKKYQQKNKQAVEALIPFVEAFKPDYIYSNSSVLGIGAQLAQQTNIPHLWHLREMAELHYHYKFYPSKQAFENLLKEAKLLIPISKAVHQAVVAPLQLTNYKVLSDAVFGRKDFEQLLEGQNTRWTTNKEKIIFLTVGLLHPSKQQALTIQAFAHLAQQYPQAELWIAGDGSVLYKKYLEWLIAKNKLGDRVKLLGYVKDMPALYHQSDVVVVASMHEGLGRTTIEGMAYEKAILGLNSGATTELIQHETTGLLFENNSQSLEAAMRQVISNPQVRIAMGKAGRLFVREHFLIEDYVAQLHKILVGL